MEYFCTMNGIYIHVPFCKKRCIYCGFYSTTLGESVRKKYVEALCNEIRLRADFFSGSRDIDSVYLGGGTPSQLSLIELEQIFQAVRQNFELKKDAEITLEVNPDDVTEIFVAGLREKTPVNRISMGVQSFNDRFLQVLNRRHDAAEAERTFYTIYNGGIKNVSIDLIYGLPGQTLEDWNADLEQTFQFPLAHLSAYALMFDEGTALWQMRKDGKVKEVNEEAYAKMFGKLMDVAEANGMEHYEISNFARPNYRAKHNAGYWHGMKYLGLGSGAHSFDGRERRWNNNDVKSYVAAGGNVDKARLYGFERLSDKDRYNEAVMLGLRTSDGIPLTMFEKAFGENNLRLLLQQSQTSIRNGFLRHDEKRNCLVLTRKGVFLEDNVARDLFQI